MRAQYSENQFLVLEKLWEQIFLSLSQDKIIETHYRVLNDKISVCYEEICIRKMNVLKSVEELSKLKDQIMDAFMKKILDESHYKILNDKILIYEQKIKDTKQELKS
jgi:hypothetical protein